MLDMTGESLFSTGNKKNLKIFSKIFLEKNFLKKTSKTSHSAEKWDPLESSGFVGYVKKVKNERGDPLQ